MGGEGPPGSQRRQGGMGRSPQVRWTPWHRRSASLRGGASTSTSPSCFAEFAESSSCPSISVTLASLALLAVSFCAEVPSSVTDEPPQIYSRTGGLQHCRSDD